MRILYDYQTFSIARFGGASRYFYELIKRISERDDTTTDVFMGYFINEYGLENYAKNFEKFWGKKHKDYYKSRLLFLHFNKIIFSSYCRKSFPDIYHQTYYTNLCLNKKVKRIVTVLDMMHELYPESFHILDKSSRNKKMAVQKADGIISISHSTKKDLIEMLNVPEKKIRVIHLGNSLKENLVGDPIVNLPYLLYVSLRKGYKNFNMLIEVYSKIKKNHPELKVVCSGGGSFTSEELNFFESLDVKNDVMYIYANDKILANLYKYAEAFIYPSKYEGFGVSLLEAMNMKCPIIASNLSSIPEILGDAGLYINPDEPEDLEKKIEMLLNDKVLRQSLIEKGNLQREKFSWDKCADETLEYYKEILGK